MSKDNFFDLSKEELTELIKNCEEKIQETRSKIEVHQQELESLYKNLKYWKDEKDILELTRDDSSFSQPLITLKMDTIDLLKKKYNKLSEKYNKLFPKY